MYGWRSERKQRLLDQLELQLDELEASATEDELAAEHAAAGTTQVKGFTRRKRVKIENISQMIFIAFMVGIGTDEK